MQKAMKIIGCVLAAIGLGCIVKHIVMMCNGDIDECCCWQHIKNTDWNSIKKWKGGSCSSYEGYGSCGSYEGYNGEPQTKKSALDDAIEKYASGEITKDQFDEIKRNLV
jgi:hypothetical protein